MGREATKFEEKYGSEGIRENSLVESLSVAYTDSIKETLRQYDLNFVISDPRLPENPIVYASDGFCTMSGYSRDEVLGRNCRFLQGPATDRRTVLELRDAIREERATQVRILNYTKKGEEFWNQLHLSPVFSKANGTVIHFLGVQTPVPNPLATPLLEKEGILNSQSSGPTSVTLPSACSEIDDTDGTVEGHESLLELGSFQASCTDTDRGSNSNSSLDSGSNPIISRFSFGSKLCEDDNGSDVHVTKRGGDFNACKAQEQESVKAAFAMKKLVRQLKESSKGKAEVLEETGNKFWERPAAGVVSSSLMLSLTRIQQSFVLADPNLPDAPIVHASDLFLHLTGYSREEVLGHNCRFLQGPGTDSKAISEIRESIMLEKPRSVRILNYRKDKRPFWNLLHVCPIRSCQGKVAYLVGVQLQVSEVDTVEEEGTGLSAHTKQLGAVGAVRVAVRSLHGEGLRRTIKSSTS